MSESNSIRQVGVISIPVLSLCLFFQLCIISHLMHHTKSKLPNNSILLSYASCICYALYSFNTLIQSIYAVSTSPAHFDALSICTYRYLTPYCFLSGKILMLLFYLTRLHNLFRHTSLNYTKRSLRLLGLYIIIGFFLAGIWFLVMIIVGFWTVDPGQLSLVQSFDECWAMLAALSFTPTFMALVVVINSVVDLSSSVIILRLYLKKLALLSATYDSYEFRSATHRAKNAKFLNIMLKTTNLVILSVSTEFMVFILHGLQMGEYWMAIDHTINVLCIYLSYGGFNDAIYNKLCCCTDSVCNKCCMRICFCCCLPAKTDRDDSMLVNEENSIPEALESTSNLSIERQLAAQMESTNKTNCSSVSSSVADDQAIDIVTKPDEN